MEEVASSASQFGKFNATLYAKEYSQSLRNGMNAESVNASWSFFVTHYQNETQAKRDDKFTYKLNNGSYYVGLEPPVDAVP